ncbi:LysR family transcriptional regulator [Sansalvadorimonas sp. 2012CJ34-2]|uniref:LysR family transcriptional regulator n=1 Tax=Parendozoicomonas callyspongiae TaxID=2942213 RepID=A0ABT0PBB7_9GAMM|nr:LysR family transcriptional regulator [Sansalvadorimonas sp. 2012CJ34-2]MCL6268680.1 LysR family transcriptional regulator [Sansalvadorimonas sp. 2012CJ34-2]
MDSQNLTAFLAVAETGSFSLAGEKLHLTQPAISKRIALLESQLEIKLFDRVGRSVVPTEAGVLLIERARHILKDIDDTRLALTNLSGNVAGKLSIATSHHIGLHRLPPVLKTFKQHYPDVSLDIRFVDSEWAYGAVQRSEIELGIITLSPNQNKSKFVSRPVWHDPLVFAVSKDHPLASEKNLSLKDISQHPAVFPGDNTFTKRIVMDYFNAQHLEIDIAMESNYLETLKMMVSIGLAWSVLPKTMLDDSLRDITPEGISVHRTLGYLHHQSRTLSNAGIALITLLKNQCL